MKGKYRTVKSNFQNENACRNIKDLQIIAGIHMTAQ